MNDLSAQEGLAPPGKPSLAEQIFPGASETAGLIRATDWSRTALGPVETWPQSLRTAVSICLGSRHPIVLWWGPERWMFYNDGLRPIMGPHKHPRYLGGRGQECWAEIWHIVGPMMDRVMATGEATWAEDFFLLMSRAGYLEETYFTFSYSPILDESGRPAGIFCACTETTGQVVGQRRMKTLRELTVQARTRTDAAGGCAEALGRNPRDVPFALVYLLDEAGTHLRLTAQAGLPAGSPASPATVALADPADTPWPLATVIEGGRSQLVDNLSARIACLPREPWDEPAHQAMVLPIAQPGWSRPAGVLVLGISPRRAFDDDYRGFLELVAGQVATALGTAELNQALADAQAAREEAVAASRAKSGFLATMSHEIRTPLNAVIGFAGMLDDQELAPRQREYARAIRESGDQLLGMINDILDFSKLQSGRFELTPAPFPLRPTLESALDFVAGKAAERGVDLAYVMGPEVPAGLEADEARVRQVLINYLSNAVKFTTRGEVVLSVQSEPDGDGRHHFHFTVRDTGRGIPPDRLDLLFQEFTTVEGAKGSQKGGTGLGLAICRKLAELQGGQVWAESTEGVGSAFHFSFQAVARPDLDPGEGRSRESLRGLRALIIDDNRTNIDILRAQTESWGMRVRSTENPLEALTWMQRGEEFDLIITDQDMPVMNGIELARSIRLLPTGTKVPLVLFSSVGGGTVTARESNVDFAAVLTKPIHQSELFDRISELFGPILASRGKGDSEAPPPVPPLSILLVEDNPMNQTVAQILLERIGYSADVAGDGAEAVEALTRKRYDVILMDVQMPVLDGLQATRAIRAQGTKGQQPHIIAMTANAMRGDRETCLEAGMDDYVSKPIGRTELADALKRAVRPAPDDSAADAGKGGPEVSPEGLARLNRDVGAEAAADLIDMFVAAAPRFMVALRTAIEGNDPEAVAATAHQLKSNCLTLGANHMGRLLQDLETAGLRGSLDGCAGPVAEVERRLWSALSELAALRR
jgi:signal transduction histidine kinase/DNA-binding response OmpR family regulator/HPt (histidine-containing phosphotransfer) domain-containing protein